MFVKQIRCALVRATTPVARFSTSLHGTALPLGVRFGRVIAAAVVFAAPAMVTPAQAGALQILDPSNLCSWAFGGTAASPTLTCNPATPPAAGTPSGCSLTATPSTIAAQASVTLNASCSANTDANTTWAWSASPAVAGLNASTQGTGTQSQILQVGATTQFSVTATNASGAGPTRSATVTLSAGGGGGGGGGGAGIKCTKYNATIVMNLTYVADGIQRVQTSNGMSPGDIMVATFTTPATLAQGFANQRGTAAYLPSSFTESGESPVMLR